jgi:hypothetical protein
MSWRMKTTSASVITRCRYRQDDVTPGSLAARLPERKSFLPISFDFFLLFLSFSSSDATPGRHCPDRARVSARQQYLQFVSLHSLRRVARTLRPETKPTGR